MSFLVMVLPFYDRYKNYDDNDIAEFAGSGMAGV